MNKLSVIIFTGAIASLSILNTVQAEAGDGDCGVGLEGNWNVKHAADIKNHVKHHLKIDRTGQNNYSVKIKNDKGDVIFKSKSDFSLSCSGEKARLSGQVKMGHCEHALEIGYSQSTDEMTIKISTVHDKGECTGHKDLLHGKDRRNHNTVASGKRRKK